MKFLDSGVLYLEANFLIKIIGKFNGMEAYSQRQLLTFGHIMDFSFSQFSPFFQNDLERNDTSFESPKVELYVPPSP